MSTKEKQLRDALHLLGDLNDVIQDTHGNVSMLDREHEVIYIKPSGMKYSSIEEDDICKLDISGFTHMTTKRKPSVDLIHHKEIYSRHRKINAICHTHSPYATAYAYNTKPIRCYSTEQSDFFGDDIYCLPYKDLNSWGEDVSLFLHFGAKAILLGRHGVLTFADTPGEAVKLAASVENCAKKNYLAEMIFNTDTRMEMKSLPKEEVNLWHKRYKKEYGQ